jgi:hypothetical protein
MSEKDRDIKIALQHFPQEPTPISPEDIEIQSRLVEVDIKREKLKSDIQDREERKDYATKVYRLLLIFLFTILAIVITGSINCSPFQLSDVVIITLLTTSSANVISIFAIVMKYLFKEKQTQQN